MSTLSFRNKNPGNIRWGEYTRSLGAREGEKGFAKFETAVQGTSALVRLLTGTSYRNLSIREAIRRYAPDSENDSAAYASFVGRHSEVDSGRSIASLSPFELLDVIYAIITFEGWEE